MSKPVVDVRGIGTVSAVLLAQHGIGSANDLAHTKVAKLMAIPGFGPARATQVIANAKALLLDAPEVTGGKGTGDAPVKPTAKKKSAKPGKKKKAKKTKEKTPKKATAKKGKNKKKKAAPKKTSSKKATPKKASAKKKK